MSDGVRPDLVNDGGVVRGVADEDVHALADLEASDPVVPADRVGGVGRAGVDSLLDGQPEGKHSELEDEEHGA